LEVGQISDPVVSDNTVYLIQLQELTPADSTAWEEQKELQRARAVFTVQQRRLEQWIEGLREAADIVDRRDEVFQSSQDQPVPTGGLF
jgi:parvulin-like peptidyl-prolyl isomerase